MRDPVLSLVQTLQSRGVGFEIVDDRVKWRGPRGSISDEEKQMLADNAPILRSILQPDTSLPDVLIIHAGVPNTLEAITTCIDAQRIRKAA